jgi:NAD(P)-dependent dehydrogenase (short-subunit alcohol dehydrogenase family)
VYQYRLGAPNLRLVRLSLQLDEHQRHASTLASDAASYVTGCAINVDGGRSPVV